MYIVDFYNSETLNLPKDRKDINFYNYLKTVFEDYLIEFQKLINEINLEFSNKNQNDINLIEIKSLFIDNNLSPYFVTKEICDQILNIFSLNQKGDVKEANKLMKDLLNGRGVCSHISRLMSKQNISKEIDNLYHFRFRIDNENLSERKDLFHIPYDKKHIVKSYRYSKTEQPCIYIAGSTYLCWEETNQKGGDVYCSKFKAVNETKILNIAYRPAVWAALFNEIIINKNKKDIDFYSERMHFILANAVCWPLIAACSIRVDINVNDKQEYIIPQLLMNWILDCTDCDGIRYFSSKMDKYYREAKPGVNFAFPATINASKGYCDKLAKKFILTEPQMFTLKDNYDNISLDDSEYQNTDFGKIEIGLSKELMDYI